MIRNIALTTAAATALLAGAATADVKIADVAELSGAGAAAGATAGAADRVTAGAAGGTGGDGRIGAVPACRRSSATGGASRCGPEAQGESVIVGSEVRRTASSSAGRGGGSTS